MHKQLFEVVMIISTMTTEIFELYLLDVTHLFTVSKNYLKETLFDL